MVLTGRRLAGALAAALIVAAIPATAHENHLQAQAEQAGTPATAAHAGAGPGHRSKPPMANDGPKPLVQRLASWLGRTHPFAVHFPIALFPVALAALILARRRGERIELIRTLIIVAGATGLAAAILGWMTAGFTLADPDWIHAWHRALGTGLALAGAVVAWWAWRRRDAVDSRAMIAGLLLITIALAVQGWLGAALVHGIEHMAF